MNLVSIHEGLADENRLRIVSLLTHGPLGVKHLQEIVGISQVRVSKHLAYLRDRGIVEVERRQNWMLYRISADPHPVLKAHLECLRECVGGMAPFEADLRARLANEGDVVRIQLLRSRAGREAEPAGATADAALEEKRKTGSDAQATWVPYGEGDYVD